MVSLTRTVLAMSTKITFLSWIALNQRNITVTEYDQAQAFGEIGAGVGFGSNARQAMKVCGLGIYEAFETIATENSWPSKRKAWFDFLNGYNKKHGHQDAEFTIYKVDGPSRVHRAHFLDQLVKLVPKSIARFGKQLNNIFEKEDGELVMSFNDGTTAEADVVIGCDGVKSRVRRIIVGESDPSAYPAYTHKYAYRGLIPMEKATEAVGEERAQNRCLYVSLRKGR